MVIIDFNTPRVICKRNIFEMYSFVHVKWHLVDYLSTMDHTDWDHKIQIAQNTKWVNHSPRIEPLCSKLCELSWGSLGIGFVMVATSIIIVECFVRIAYVGW